MSKTDLENKNKLAMKFAGPVDENGNKKDNIVIVQNNITQNYLKSFLNGFFSALGAWFASLLIIGLLLYIASIVLMPYIQKFLG